MARTTIDPITRIEGHLPIDCQVDGSKVTSAWSSSQMWRGIEKILEGRDPRDASIFTQRICGVCTTAHIARTGCVNRVRSGPRRGNAVPAAGQGVEWSSDRRDEMLDDADLQVGPRYSSLPYSQARVAVIAMMMSRQRSTPAWSPSWRQAFSAERVMFSAAWKLPSATNRSILCCS